MYPHFIFVLFSSIIQKILRYYPDSKIKTLPAQRSQEKITPWKRLVLQQSAELIALNKLNAKTITHKLFRIGYAENRECRWGKENV